MVELERLPVLVGVAELALLAEPAPVSLLLVVLLVAGGAGDRRVLVVILRVAVLAQDLRIGVRILQRELRLVMVEEDVLLLP